MQYISPKAQKMETNQHLLSLPDMGCRSDSEGLTLKTTMNMNIIGRLTKDAQVHTTSNAKQVVNFSIAINESYRNKQGERMQQTTYFDCAYWISPNVAKILTKGTLVELTGRVSARAWVDKDGNARSGLNFHTSKITLHGSSKRDGNTPAQATTAAESTKALQYQNVEDDLPF